MGALYRLKAYFGMVPAEELGEYADEAEVERYAPARRPDRAVRDSGREYADDRWDERFSHDEDREYDDEWERRPARPVGVDRGVSAGRDQGRGTSGIGSSAVRGSLAIDPEAAARDLARREESLRESVLRESVLREPARLSERPAATAVPEQRDRGAAVLARITTLQPRSYNEARTIGERYREGVPVIMNLTELDDAAAKRLVDFAAGLVFALRGGFDKVTNRVFLLTPADVEVSADDARRIAERSAGVTRADAERGLFRQD